MTSTQVVTSPLVAVCLASFEPQGDLLRRQVESLRAQTHGHFVCIVSDDLSSPEAFAAVQTICADDDRFVVSRSPDRLGFYRNFERALALVPAGAQYVAFSDQDDVWHPAKLETLLAVLESSGAELAYSDMNIVTTNGRVLADSYWTDRRNNYTDLGSLIITNTVTGAASLFRRQLLDNALPFPSARGRVYHDHWIACIALSLGGIAFVDRPLHDYVQHGSNVVGRHLPLPDDYKGGLVNATRRFARNPLLRLWNTAGHARRYYEDEVVPRELFAKELERRLAGRMPRDKARTLNRVAHLSTSWRSFGWLLVRSARDLRGESETLGMENQLLKGILWHRTQSALWRRRRARHA